MQRVHSSYHYVLQSVAGSIFNMAPKYFSASYDRMSNQQIMDMIGWVAGKGKDFDVLNAPIIYPDLKVNAKKVFGNWFMIVKVQCSWQTYQTIYSSFSNSLSKLQWVARCQSIQSQDVVEVWACTISCCNFGMFPILQY